MMLFSLIYFIIFIYRIVNFQAPASSVVNYNLSELVLETFIIYLSLGLLIFLVLIFILVAVMAPIVEEIMFRGVLYSYLKKWMSF